MRSESPNEERGVPDRMAAAASSGMNAGASSERNGAAVGPPRSDAFAHRHLGPGDADVAAMLDVLGVPSLDDLIDRIVPAVIRHRGSLDLPAPRGEMEVLADLRGLAARNTLHRSYLGMGYHGCITPPVIQRGILEDPGWYTQYTPYQAEISQGRLEALFNFQTMVLDLTAMEVANASLLDEATAAAEAMTLCRRVSPDGGARNRFLVSSDCHPQTIAVVVTRAEPLGIEVLAGDPATFEFDSSVIGALLQYPSTDGEVRDHGPFCERAHGAGARVVVAADLLALTLLRPPGEFGADVVIGNTQRFGMPMCYGGPHAAFMATRDAYKRQMPGRIVGQSIDAAGEPALRLALQTREQHIRRDRATSNICTAEVLPAVVASMYALYHGPDGLRAIAERVRWHARVLVDALRGGGAEVLTRCFFDTIRVRPAARSADAVLDDARRRGINLRDFRDGTIGVALDETVDADDVATIVAAFGEAPGPMEPLPAAHDALPALHRRTSDYLSHPVFRTHHSETELVRYMHRLREKDLSLTTSMIPLGSCTMKLNATTEMVPITWPEYAQLHPFVPADQAEGYRALHSALEHWLAEITGLPAVSLQPNAGSQGEYAGLLVIRAHHRAHREPQRNTCLIPTSAHGTNPASARLAGMDVGVVRCDVAGNIDLDHLRAQAAQHRDDLAALMITYPSTHGVFEETIVEICAIIHDAGGQVYLDGANMNALVGLCRPGSFGVDVCHLNLHKTFCIPHGGGGPGMGPICAAEHLRPFLPGHPLVEMGGAHAIGTVSAAPWGSPAILPISYAYIAMMGVEGLTRASQIAILNANYIARRLEPHYPVLYRGRDGWVAHECIIDVRPVKRTAGVDVADVAKRLMDYGFHAPTMSWPVAGTLMIEPTESESKAELDRFCDAMIGVREEIREIEEGKADREQNVLKGAPHTARLVCSDAWSRPYSRERACFPAPWSREHKYWPPVCRVDDSHGDRHLVCACPPVDAYAHS